MPQMTSIQNLSNARQDALRSRLKKIEGQARGIQKMMDDDRDCVAIVEQIASMRAAVTSLHGEMLESFAIHCLNHPEESSGATESVSKMVKLLVKHSR
jgi:DNA-binding FrmR family transcriptional regulator